ncbi:MAG: HPr family phosphocarrier protein [Nitrospinae bacterium]|nr:HPr family phosphocarrier protein [Nitrospinota bacterium]
MTSNGSSSLTPIINEDDFLPLVHRECQEFFSVLSALRGGQGVLLGRAYYFTLLQAAEKLESFLDDHGARTNLRLLFFAELVACVRNFSLAGFQLYHVLDRYSDYLGGERDTKRRDFEKGATATLTYFAEAITRFYTALLAETDRLAIRVQPSAPDMEKWGVKVTPRLPYTIAGEEAEDESERIVAIAQAYRRVVKSFKTHRFHRKLKAVSLSEIIPSKLNETLLAELESQLHNIQSEYDTHVRGGTTEKNNGWMITLRGLTAIPMHLFDMLRWLVHFYERHENQIRKSDVKSRVSDLVDDINLIASITDFGLGFIGRFLAEGNEVAERILTMYVEPIIYELPLPQPQGFHARPATYISLIVQEHGTDAFLLIDGKKYNCRSVLELLEAGGALADQGARTVKIEGDRRTLDDLKILADHNYCEDQDIPKDLNYLRILRNM